MQSDTKSTTRGVSAQAVAPRVAYAIILAGGSGLRAGGDTPKQFQLLDGIPLLWWSVRAFIRQNPQTRIILVMHPGFFDLWDILHAELPEEDRKIEYELVCGGRTRGESVVHGLNYVEGPDALVAVHDAARPFLTANLIAEGWKMAAATGSAIPVTAVTDSLREITGEGESVSVDRSKFRAVQTPQTFIAGKLKEAYEKTGNLNLSDDASVYQEVYGKVSLIEGYPYNIKITNPLDIKIAQVIAEDLSSCTI